MKKLFMSVALLLLVVTSFAQTPGYEFTTVVSHQATPVKDQGSTGTCWCFATASFMESELLRMGKGEYDLAEMFIVRQKYMNQMEDNYLVVKEVSVKEVWHTLSKTLIRKRESFRKKCTPDCRAIRKTTITEHCHATSKHW